MTTTTLSTWHDSERALPLGLAVTALFSANARSVGSEAKDKVILSRSGASITYTGPSLGTDDMDVLMALSHLARGATSSGDTLEIQTSFAELLETLSWPVHTHYYDRLDAALMRLSRAHLNLKEFGGAKGRRVTKNVFGTLLGVTRTVDSGDGRERSISTPISKSMLLMWQELVRVSWSQRKLLKRNLARWLQTYVVFGETTEREYLVDELMEMCNFEGETVEFRRRLKEAGDELVAARFLSSYKVTRLGVLFVSGEPCRPSSPLPIALKQGAAAKRAAMANLSKQLSLGE